MLSYVDVTYVVRMPEPRRVLLSWSDCNGPSVGGQDASTGKGKLLENERDGRAAAQKP